MRRHRRLLLASLAAVLLAATALGLLRWRSRRADQRTVAGYHAIAAGMTIEEAEAALALEPCEALVRWPEDDYVTEHAANFESVGSGFRTYRNGHHYEVMLWYNRGDRRVTTKGLIRHERNYADRLGGQARRLLP